MTSLYDQIRSQIERDGELDLDSFPNVAEFEVRGASFSFSPGLMDALITDEDGDKNTRKAASVIDKVKAGDIADRASLESALSGIRAMPTTREMLDYFEASPLPPATVGLFWTMAVDSTDYEAVKWGVLVRGLATHHEQPMSDDEANVVATLAKHPELTEACSLALAIGSDVQPELADARVEQLESVRDWGFVSLASSIMRYEELIARRDVRERILRLTFENLSYGELEWEIAESIITETGLQPFIELANDPELAPLVSKLLSIYLDAGYPFDNLEDIPEGQRYLEEHIERLESSSGVMSFEALYGLHDYLGEEADDDKLHVWPEDYRRRQQTRVEELLERQATDDVLREALAARSWAAAQFIPSRGRTALVGDAVTLFERDNENIAALRVIARLGSPEQLEKLRLTIPELVNLEARAKLPITRDDEGDEFREAEKRDKGVQYTIILRAMGRLQTPEAIEAIKVGLKDFGVLEREAACEAVALLPAEAVDAELKGLLVDRLGDPMFQVRAEAMKAIKKYGVRAPRFRMWKVAREQRKFGW